MKKTLFRLILLSFVLGVVLFAVFIAEGVMGAMGMPRQGVYREIVMREQPPLQKVYETDNGKTVKIEVDANGFLVPSQVHEKADYNIVFLGGSTTLCKAVTETLRWPYLTGRILEKQISKTVNTYNNGVEGSNTAHSLNILYNKIIPLNPDYVVLMHAFNDMIALLYCGDYWNEHPSRSLIRVKTTRSGIFNAFRNTMPHLSLVLENIRNYLRDNWLGGGDEFASVRGSQISYDREFMLRRFKNNLLLFIQMCRINDLAPVLMTQANRVTQTPDSDILKNTEKSLSGTGISYQDYRTLYAAFNQVIREVAAENNVPLIDLAAGVEPTEQNFHDHLHYTDKGSETVAAIIAQRMQEIISSAQSTRVK